MFSAMQVTITPFVTNSAGTLSPQFLLSLPATVGAYQLLSGRPGRSGNRSVRPSEPKYMSPILRVIGGR